jgi:Holliday junction resolvase RusA-like endonuclease
MRFGSLLLLERFMGLDIDLIKNPQLRERLLKLKARELSRPLASAMEPPAAPVPLHVPVPMSVSSSTNDHPQPKKSTEIFCFTVKGLPMGKPRMTQRDKWQKRPCVIRYREYCDKIRGEAGEIPADPLAVHIKAYLPMAESWSKKKKAASAGQRQRLKPDWDNIGKAICDALFSEDSCIAVGICEKFWCNSGDERTEVTVIYAESVLKRYGIGLDQ